MGLLGIASSGGTRSLRMPEFVLRRGKPQPHRACVPTTKTTSLSIFVNGCSWSPTAWGARTAAKSPAAWRSISFRVCFTPIWQGNEPAEQALLQAMRETNELIVEAGRSQPEGRRMGTTAVVALQHNGQVYISILGDSRAYLIRGQEVRPADGRSLGGAGTGRDRRLDARGSPLQSVSACAAQVSRLRRFELRDRSASFYAAERRSAVARHRRHDQSHHRRRPSCRPKQFPDPQIWIDHLVQKALDHGSRDNVTGVVIAFEEIS